MHTAIAPSLFDEIVRTQEHFLERKPPFWLRLIGFRWSALIFRKSTTRQLHKLERDYFEVSLILKGFLAEMIATASSHPNAQPYSDSIIQSLESIERSLLSNRARLLRICAKQPATRDFDFYRVSFSEVIGANADAFEAAQALRWELMEQQADADIQAGRAQTFESADAAIAFLNSQT